MYETNIWLDAQDLTKLTKMAQKKMLSLSTYINIIVKVYYGCCNENAIKDAINSKFLHKGQKQTHIKLRNENKIALTPKIITNCVYIYLHNENHELAKYINFKTLNKKIQSECDKTKDNNYLQNLIIRATYNFNRKRK